MDFLHPHKKKKQKFQLFLGYFLMAIALGIATFIMVFFTLGYDIDPKTGDVITKGLVILDAHPEAADIYINGEYRGVTNSRFVLPAGTYSAELRRQGYRSWSHDFNLAGSDIERLVYPFLFPETLQTSSIRSVASAPGVFSQSPSRQWLIVEQPGKLGSFDMIDLNDFENPTKTISLPADTLTQAKGKHSLSPVEWADDNDHLLIKHTYRGGSEYIVLDRGNPLDSLNVSKVFSNQSASNVELWDKKPDLFYFYNKSTKSLLRMDSSSKEVDPILKNVLAFKPYHNDTVLYVKSTSSKKTVEVRLLKGDDDYLLRTLPASSDYLLEAAEFAGKFYVVAGGSADNRTYIYEEPLRQIANASKKTPSAFRVIVVDGAQFVSFSQNARFISVQGGNDFGVYDLEEDRQYRYQTEHDLSKNSKATWMDGHRLTAISQGKLHVFDFDNTNHQELDVADARYQPVFNRDYDALYSLVPKDDKSKSFNLNRTELRFEPERFR